MKKGAMLALLSGVTLFGGGCLGGLDWQRMFWTTAIYAGQEFVFDNDTVFDLFEDGEPTSTSTE